VNRIRDLLFPPRCDLDALERLDATGTLDFTSCLPLDFAVVWLQPAPDLVDAGVPACVEVPQQLPTDGRLLSAVWRSFERVEARIGAAAHARHALVCGASGSGKSTLMRRLIQQDIGSGCTGDSTR